VIVANRTHWPALMAVAALAAGCSSAERNDIAVGLLESDRVELRADAAEPVTRILVTEGQAVQAHDALMQLDTRRLDARITEAQAALAQQQAVLAELVRGPRKEQIAAARASLQAASSDRAFRQLELQRADDLLARKLASPDEADRARAAFDAARAQVALHTARLDELLSGTTVEELTQVEQLVAQASARVQQLDLDRDRLTLRAPADGYIDTIVFERGERPTPGQTLMVMLTGPQPYARVYVPEALRVSLAPGDEANIAVDGLGEVLRGRVRHVTSASSFTPYFALTRHDRGRLSYVAEIDLLRSGTRLPDGVPVEVSFGVAPAPDAADE